MTEPKKPPQLSASYKADLECMICSRQWEAIYPVDHQTAPCPDCGYENVVPTARET